jgi:hypothetical protein
VTPAPLSGVALSLPRTEYRRGETVELSVTSAAADGSPLLAGLVCTERYYDPDPDIGGFYTATQWDHWREVSTSTSLPQRVSLEIPASEPYTHEGTVWSIWWAVVVRRPLRLRPDPTISEPIRTLP